MPPRDPKARRIPKSPRRGEVDATPRALAGSPGTRKRRPTVPEPPSPPEPQGPLAALGDLTEEERALVQQAAHDQLCIDDFREFVRAAWPIVEQGNNFDPNWHVDAIAEELARVYPGVRGEEPPLGWEVAVVRPPPGTPPEALDGWRPSVVSRVDTWEEAQDILEYLGSPERDPEHPHPSQVEVRPAGNLTRVDEPWRVHCPAAARPAPLWRNSRLIINIPPGQMKSLLVSVFWPAWVWIRDPGHRSLSISGSDKISIRDAMRTRTILRTKWYWRLVDRHYMNLKRSSMEALDGIVRRDHQTLVSKGIMGSYYGAARKEGGGARTAAGETASATAWGISRNKDAKSSFGTTRGGYRESKSIGGDITGERGYGWTLDDPIDAKEVIEHGQVDHHRIAERCAEVVSTIDKALDSRVNDRRDGLFYNVIIMQRLHIDDPCGTLYRKTVEGRIKPWRMVVIRAEYVPDSELGAEDPPNYEFDPRTQAGELMNPVRLPADVLTELRIRMDDQYDAQMQQNPLPGKGGMMSQAIDVCKRYKDDPFRVAGGTAGHTTDDGRKVGQLEVMISVDATFGSKGATASNVAVEVWGRSYNARGRMYLLDCVASRMNYTETENAVIAMKKKWPMARTVIIEEKANGATLIHRLKSRIPGVVPFDPKGSKTVRAGVLASGMKIGEVWIPEGDPRTNTPANLFTPWIMDFVTECVRFPGGRRDDRVDAASCAVIYWTENDDASAQANTSNMIEALRIIRDQRAREDHGRHQGFMVLRR